MEHHTVRIVARPGNFWWLEHGGPVGDQIRDLTGSYVTPTPFPLTIPITEVRDAIQRIAPETKVIE